MMNILHMLQIYNFIDYVPYEELGMVYISTKYELLTFHARCYFCVFTVISDIIKKCVVT